MAKIKICLDPGHYGNYNQSPVVKKYYEAVQMWKLHLLLKKELESYGFEVSVTRTDASKDLDLYARGQKAKGCDLFLSLHSNSAERESADHPVLIYPISGKGKDLATQLATCVKQTMSCKEAIECWSKQGKNGDYYGVIRGAVSVGVVGIIIEHGFHTNKANAEWLLSDDNLARLAKAEANVIAKYYKVEKPSVTESKTTVKEYKVVTSINKYMSEDEASKQINSQGKYTAGTYYIYNKYPNGKDGMYNISKDATGSSAGSWINPKENVIATTTTPVEKLYRVRKSKDDEKSQKGAYSDLNNAKDCCQAAGSGYHVFDWNWKIVYSYIELITLTSIAVTAKPTKTTYIINESFDSKGLVVTATYSDKSTKTITGYTLSGFTAAKAGTIAVKVTFEGKTTTFNITVKEKPVETVTAVYDLDYPEKTKIINKTIKRTEADCVKTIKLILSNNKAFDIEIAKTFFELAPRYGIDPMMAIAQSILETGWFKYENSAVTPDQHNYCGMGVVTNGVKGNSFVTINDGVIAQLQHLFAYGCKDALPSGDKVLDPRFTLVTRGIAPYWQQLAGRWACPGFDSKTYSTPQKALEAGNTYGQKILTLYKKLCATTVSATEIDKYFPKAPAVEVIPETPSKTEDSKEATSEIPLPVGKPDIKEPEPPVLREPENESEKEPDKTTETVPEEPSKEDKPEIQPSKPEEPKEPEVEETPTKPDGPKDESDNRVNETNEQTAENIVDLILRCIKKLIQALANIFNKGE